MFLMVLGPSVTGRALAFCRLFAGAYYVWCWKQGSQCWGSTGQKLTDGLCGAFGLLVGLTFLTVTCHLQQLVV